MVTAVFAKIDIPITTQEILSFTFTDGIRRQTPESLTVDEYRRAHKYPFAAITLFTTRASSRWRTPSV